MVAPLKNLVLVAAVPLSENRRYLVPWLFLGRRIAQPVNRFPNFFVTNAKVSIYNCGELLLLNCSVYALAITIRYGAYMSKTFTVKEVAVALGITPRGVVQRLNRNQLKGTRKTNQFGTPEWQVYATREISQAIESLKSDPSALAQQSFAPDANDNYEDAIDVEDVDVEEAFEQSDWIDVERKRMELMAEALVKPLTEQLVFQAAALREKELQLEDKDRQLRLLPDLQKRAEDERKVAEVERKAAEERALEVIALKKQVSALEAIKESATSRVEEADSELQQLKLLKDSEARILGDENERLKQQVEEAVLNAQKLTDLEKVVQELQKPKPTFWQKFFGGQSG